MHISSLSTEYITVTVTATVAGNPIDLSGDVVAWAFADPGVPPATWIVGDWSNGSARVLVGPAVNPLPKGTRDVWLKVTDSPEIPVRKVGQILVY
jgi:hypothetical protein